MAALPSRRQLPGRRGTLRGHARRSGRSTTDPRPHTRSCEWTSCVSTGGTDDAGSTDGRRGRPGVRGRPDGPAGTRLGRSGASTSSRCATAGSPPCGPMRTRRRPSIADVSLIGVDLGTSAIKVSAYSLDGSLLAQARQAVPGTHPEPGHWEVDVRLSRDAFRACLAAVAGDPAVRRDPPTALSFSSSGREVFPVAADGSPLGPCLMTADTRGDDVAQVTASRRSDEEWFRLAGHVPRRMDPVNRALWWQRTAPEVTARTRWFMNWHEFYRAVPDGSARGGLERRGDLGDVRRGHRWLVAGAHRRDRHRCRVAAGRPAQRDAHRPDPAGGRERPGPATGPAGGHRRLRHLRGIGRLGGHRPGRACRSPAARGTPTTWPSSRAGRWTWCTPV